MKLQSTLPKQVGFIYFLPVLDLLALVLIFPLLGSAFNSDAGRQVELVNTSFQFKRLEHSVVVTVKGVVKPRVWINRDISSLETYLADIQKETKDWRRGGPVGVILRVDRQVPNGVKDEMIEKLSLQGYQVAVMGNQAQGGD